MTNTSTNAPALQSQPATAVHLLDDWFDPIEAGLRERVREFIQGMIEAELEAALARPRTPAGERRLPRMPMARAVLRATGTATDHGLCWGPLAESRSRCRGPGSPPQRARQPSGRVWRCGPTSAEPSRPIR